jgi:carboxyl-terminal processing protease
MSIQNKKSVVLFPLILALVLIIGMLFGVKLSHSGISERLLIYPRADKVNNVLNLIEDSYVDTVSRDKLEEVAIESILQKLDPHSVYIPANEFQEMNEPLEGNFSGIGIQFNMQNDTVVVTSTIVNGPSKKVGVKPGDRIVKVNDSIIAGVKMTDDNIIKKLKGEKGTLVKISVKRRGINGLIDFKISRDKILLSSIDVSYLIAPKIGYIKINKFSKTASDEFIAAVKKLHSRGMKKLIVDLRGNGGGLLETAIKIADQFLDDRQLIVYTEGRARSRSNSYSTPGGECLHDLLIVLLDETSASASEVFAGAIQDNDRGLIVGRRSFGKGLVQEQSLLPGGSAIRLTIARYYTPTGRCIQKPYNKGKDNYLEEVHKRFLHGEMEQADSIKFNDSLKYVTPRGHIVYGGGGIMPDFFVPIDTSAFSEYFYQVREKGLINNYAFYYSDTNRPLLSKFKTYHDLANYLKKKNILEKFVKYADEHGVKRNFNDLKISSSVLQVYLEATIVRNFFDNAGFYPMINSIDNTMHKAIEIFKTKS